MPAAAEVTTGEPRRHASLTAHRSTMPRPALRLATEKRSTTGRAHHLG